MVAFWLVTGLIFMAYYQYQARQRQLALAQPEAVLVTPRVAPWGTRLAMLIDPDGYRLEFQAGAAA